MNKEIEKLKKDSTKQGKKIDKLIQDVEMLKADYEELRQEVIGIDIDLQDVISRID